MVGQAECMWGQVLNGEGGIREYSCRIRGRRRERRWDGRSRIENYIYNMFGKDRFG